MTFPQRDPEAADLLEKFRKRREGWTALFGVLEQTHQDSASVRAAHKATVAQTKGFAEDAGKAAKICKDVKGLGMDTLRFRLEKAGLPTDLAELREQGVNLAHAMAFPGDAMPECRMLAGSPMLRKYEKFLASGKYDKALNLLKSEEPGFLTRTFSPSRAAAIQADIDALRTYAGYHEQWRKRLKEAEKLIPAAEREAATALYKILKSDAWKELSARQLPEEIEKDPAIVLLRKYSGEDVKHGFFGRRTIRSIEHDLEKLYVETGKTVDPGKMATLFETLESSARETLKAARVEHGAAGQAYKENHVKLSDHKRQAEGELFVTLRGRKVDLVHALELTAGGSGNFDPQERRELLEAARSVMAKWDENGVPAPEAAQQIPARTGFFAATGRFLSDAFNLAAVGVNELHRRYDSFKNGPDPYYTRTPIPGVA